MEEQKEEEEDVVPGNNYCVLGVCDAAAADLIAISSPRDSLSLCLCKESRKKKKKKKKLVVYKGKQLDSGQPNNLTQWWYSSVTH